MPLLAWPLTLIPSPAVHGSLSLWQMEAQAIAQKERDKADAALRAQQHQARAMAAAQQQSSTQGNYPNPNDFKMQPRAAPPKKPKQTKPKKLTAEFAATVYGGQVGAVETTVEAPPASAHLEPPHSPLAGCCCHWLVERAV